ncbi:glycosyltransferase family 2 protein [Actinocrispum wychmicini]|uniref:Rhamnosyltransferase n=1 Tax=Actinocrispum wychmicini TaxID=1213861 RepID=A0A4R2JX11_9PSEU|nr:glycosyltransferase family 2 protein [Actinocrispum wychmicini]TCO58685.1 rhamnosyltransferase [Actinocrispum wychmicini]
MRHLGSPGVPKRISAIVTAYHPDERLLAVIEAARAACVEVLVVDNTPDGSPLLAGELPDGARVLRSSKNLGLAGALNLGWRSLSPDCDAVLLLDQDSVVPEQLVTQLAAHLDTPSVGAVAPSPWDAERGSYIDPRTTLRPDVADRDAVMTSGLIVRRSLLDKLGGFREDFFVDCVDHDFCLRLRRAGYRIVQDKRVRLPHSLGDLREHRFLIGHVRVTHHPTWRLYWVVRNGVVLVRENLAAKPVWSLTSILIMVRWAMLTALYERPRGKRLTAMWRGLQDGVTGRTDRRFLPAGASVGDVIDA